MEILSIKEYEDMISWMPDGKSFFIYDKNKLNAILSYYFQSSKYDSFRRKLHRWGFRITKKGSSAGSYTHKLFVRDNPSLCSKMRCAKQGCSAKTPERSSDKSNASKNDMVVPKEIEDSNKTIEQNQQINQQARSLKTYNDIEKHKRIFQNYVMTMHTNFWQKRPLLLEGSFYLQRHVQSISQSSKELGSINGLLTFNSEGQTLSPGTINDKMEIYTVSHISNKSGSTKPYVASDRNARINSTNAIAA